MAIAHEVIRIVQAFQATGEVPNVVNRLARSSATHVLVIRHRNRPGVLAHVFGVLAGAEINVEEVENIIYHGAQATLARIHLDGEPGNGALERIKSGNTDIISVELSEIDGEVAVSHARPCRRPSHSGDDSMSKRIFNFSAGPAVLPEPVLQKAQEAIWDVAGSGIGIMEHSHRGKVFDRIRDEAEQACRELAGHPGQLPGAVPPGRRVAPVLDGADEPAARRTAPPTTCSPACGRRRR